MTTVSARKPQSRSISTDLSANQSNAAQTLWRSMILNPTLFKACFYAIFRTPINRRSIGTHRTIDSLTQLQLAMYYSFHFLLSFEVDSDCNHTIVTTQQNRMRPYNSVVHKWTSHVNQIYNTVRNWIRHKWEVAFNRSLAMTHEINIVHTQPLTIVHISSVTYIKSDHSPHIELKRTTNGILPNRVITMTIMEDFESA